MKEQLIDETEFGFRQVDESASGPKVTSRRPVGLLLDSQVTRLSARSDFIPTVYVLCHYGLIAILGWLSWAMFPSYWCLFPVLGQAVVIGFLFSPLHECAHGSAFKSRWINESILWVTALVYVVPPYFFRYFHLGHHRYTQVPGKDPSLVLPEPATLRQYVWYCAGLWFWWRNISWIIKHAFGKVDPASKTYVPHKRVHLMVLEARVMMIVYCTFFGLAMAAGAGPALIICWLLPRLIGEPIQRILRVAEHVGCSETPDILSNTRTTLSARWVHLLAWQMPYHAEHHLFPNIPFYRSPETHQLVAKHVIIESNGYVAGQRNIVRQLRQNSKGQKDFGFNTPVL